METKKIRAKVHMLPSKDKSEVVLHESGKLGCLARLSLNMDWEFVEKDWTNQHLYFTTDEDIKEGDWFIQIHQGEKNIVKCDTQNKNVVNTHQTQFLKAFKIVATTDTSLQCKGCLDNKNEQKYFYDCNCIPHPPQTFLKNYVEVGGSIDEVNIEYFKDRFIHVASAFGSKIEGKIIVDSHNTITIHSIKDSWSREELTDILQAYRLDYEQYKRSCHYGPNQKEIVDWSNKWIKENL